MSNFWSEQLPTPIFLEWTAVYSIFFGVDTFSLQNVGLHVVKVKSAFSLTQGLRDSNTTGQCLVNFIFMLKLRILGFNTLEFDGNLLTQDNVACKSNLTYHCHKHNYY
jgi:hypothetical protein